MYDLARYDMNPTENLILRNLLLIVIRFVKDLSVSLDLMI